MLGLVAVWLSVIYIIYVVLFGCMYKSDAVSYSLITREFIMGRLSNKKERAKTTQEV